MLYNEIQLDSSQTLSEYYLPCRIINEPLFIGPDNKLILDSFPPPSLHILLRTLNHILDKLTEAGKKYFLDENGNVVDIVLQFAKENWIGNIQTLCVLFIPFYWLKPMIVKSVSDNFILYYLLNLFHSDYRSAIRGLPFLSINKIKHTDFISQLSVFLCLIWARSLQKKVAMNCQISKINYRSNGSKFTLLNIWL